MFKGEGMCLRHLLIKCLVLALMIFSCIGELYGDSSVPRVPVFPGAEGFGTLTPGGRGGKLIIVSNLNDKGSGSLRAAIEKNGPRIIVFEAGGLIALSEDLVIKDPFITIAGQTAPSPGITLTGAGVRVKTHDVLVQHLRIRVGDGPQGENPGNRDAVQLLGKVNGSDVYNIVVDHISVSWAIDENGSTWFPLRDVTISNSIFSEALNDSLHPKGPHSKGFLVGDFASNIAMVGNLMAHNKERNPLLKGGTSAVILNNLIYNGGHRFYGCLAIVDDVSAGPVMLSAVGNVFQPGSNSPVSANVINVADNIMAGSRIFVDDNLGGGDNVPDHLRAAVPPIWHNSLKAKRSEVVAAWVLANAGARPQERDAVDSRIVEEVLRKQGRVINSPNEVGGMPRYKATYRPFFYLPEPNADDDKDGYTNIEEVLHRMAYVLENREKISQNDTKKRNK